MNGPILTAIITGVSSTISAAAAWITATITNHGKEKVARVQTHAPEWQAFVSTIQEETRQLSGRVNSLQTQVDTLRSQVNSLSHKYVVAINHIEEWRSSHPDEIKKHPAPKIIRPDL